MRNTSSLLSPAAVVICIIALLAACGGNRDSAATNGTANSTATNTANRHTPPATTAVSPSVTATTATPSSSPQQYADGVRRVTINELRDAMAKGEAVVIDVRGAQGYATGHIKDSRLFPEDQIVARAKELPRDKLIVTYCA
ncbi:MAG: rhodanese-like domain-containing protein [Pyrinomonadaceae bacterium]|nr:rhodanese-like domain-containing protein [Pyrinomonadaceae bacterium]